MLPQAGPAPLRAPAGGCGRAAAADPGRVELQQPGRRRQEPGEERGARRRGAAALEEGRPAAAAREGGRSTPAAGGRFESRGLGREHVKMLQLLGRSAAASRGVTSLSGWRPTRSAAGRLEPVII